MCAWQKAEAPSLSMDTAKSKIASGNRNLYAVARARITTDRPVYRAVPAKGARGGHDIVSDRGMLERHAPRRHVPEAPCGHRAWHAIARRARGLPGTVWRACSIVVLAMVLIPISGCASLPGGSGADVCRANFLNLAQPMYFPGKVRSIHWTNAVLGRGQPMVDGNWTIHFPGNQSPIARMASISSGWNSVMQSSIQMTWIYIDGLQCTNPVSGTQACSLIMRRFYAPTARTDNDKVQFYFVTGTPAVMQNGALDESTGFIAYTGCPWKIDYAQ